METTQCGYTEWGVEMDIENSVNPRGVALCANEKAARSMAKSSGKRHPRVVSRKIVVGDWNESR